jgi:3-phosphoshikimate 1-carboxyvinyltransferase
MSVTTNIETSGGAVTVTPIRRVRGEMRVPGDKSVSHRAAMVASVAEGRSVVRNFSTARDCAATLECLRALGVSIEVEGATVGVEGAGAEGLRAPAAELDAQNSGTTVRLLAGVLAGQAFEATLTGDESLRSRPMRRVAEPLRLMGAEVETQTDGCAPLRVRGRRPLRAITYRLPVASAQIKSAVLLAGLFADGTTTVEEPAPTRDHTERMLREFGAEVSREGVRVSVRGGAKLRAREFSVPGDVSSAAFFVAAAVVLPGSDLTIRDVGLNPTRTAFLDALTKLGADVQVNDRRLECGEPVGTLRVRGRAPGGSRSRPETSGALEISGAVVANLIDELPLLAFVAAATGRGLEVSGARELRVKESDRIRATVENLGRMGARVEEREDGWRVLGRGEPLRGAALDSFGDHRIAMACAVAALACDGASEIAGAREAVAVSLPEFWSLLGGVVE